MLKDIRHLFLRNSLIIAVALTLLIAYLSLGRPIDLKVDIDFQNADKIKHALAYFVLSYSWMSEFFKRGILHKYKKQIFFVLFLYGVLMEVLQFTLTSHRQGDYLDLLANFFGIFMCYLFFNKIHEKISVKL